MGLLGLLVWLAMVTGRMTAKGLDRSTVLVSRKNWVHIYATTNVTSYFARTGFRLFL